MKLFKKLKDKRGMGLPTVLGVVIFTHSDGSDLIYCHPQSITIHPK
jgi:hypothetical protein